MLSHDDDSLLSSPQLFLLWSASSAADSRMATAPFEREMARSLSNRGQSVENIVLADFMGWLQIFKFVGVLTYYLKRCAPCVWIHHPATV